jgi:hypothetical protein
MHARARPRLPDGKRTAIRGPIAKAAGSMASRIEQNPRHIAVLPAD